MSDDNFPHQRFGVIALFLLFLNYSLLLSHKINLLVADLGRHLQNGYQLFTHPELLTTNFYSYSQPNFPFINHHWATGLLFMVIHRVVGFPGLSLFFIFLSLGVLAAFLTASSRKFGLLPSLAAGSLALSLLAERTEIRPEALSYFFAGLYYLCLTVWPGRRRLYFLPLIQLLWVNLHIYFFLGPFLLASYLVRDFFVTGKNWRSILSSRLMKVTLLAGLACLVNPFFLKGALAPLNIFHNYGYVLVENLGVFTLLSLLPSFNLYYFLFFSLVVIAALLYLARCRSLPWPETFFTLFFVVLGAQSIRNLVLAALFSFPLIAAAFRKLLQSPSFARRHLAVGAVVCNLIFLGFCLLGGLRYYPYWREFGFGLETGSSEANRFVRDNSLKGPIFNDYDTGGFLIYSLYPEKVFVDNRPEAYPALFFKNTYIPAQLDEQVWQQLDGQYRFNAIFFNRLGYTDWARQFIARRLQDPDWANVYSQDNAIIFLRNSPENQPVITRYRIKPNPSFFQSPF